jgi:hypothetical protein
VTSSLFPASQVIRLYTGNVLAAVNTFSASVGTGTNDADLEGNVTALGALLGVENEQSVQVAGALPHAVTPENPAAAGARPRHGWMKPLFKDLSTNPYTQYKVHMWGAIYWLINFPLICCLFFFTPTLWLKLGIFITLIYSIYANLATDYGAMSAAEAAFGAPQPPPIPLEPPLPSM